MAGVTDVFTTVTVPKAEYESLVRDSEMLSIIEKLMRKNRILTSSELRIILGIEESEEKKSESV